MSGIGLVGQETQDYIVRVWNNFPEELKELEQFVVWRYEDHRGRRTKVPYHPRNGMRASINNRETWTTFTMALAAYRQSNRYAGIGFVFTAGDPYCGIDLDHCLDAQGAWINPSAREYVDRLASYTELSPSRTGLHVYVRAKLPAGGRRSNGVEMYDRDRFFTITGSRIDDAPYELIDRYVEVARLHAELFPTPQFHTPPRKRPSTDYDDTTVRAHILASLDGPRFKMLWEGRWDLCGYPSQSEGDLALVGILAKWLGDDPARIDSLFRRSALFRPKWDERRGLRTYGQHTITRVTGVKE